jgi:hypothetical protein
MELQIKKIAELENTLGKTLARNILAYMKRDKNMGIGYTRVPNRVEFHKVKPEFHLSDGDCLDAIAVDLTTGVIEGSRYCGSGCSAINHPEQFDNTYKAPDNKALIFIKSYWNGRNSSWVLYVVTSNVPEQIKP